MDAKSENEVPNSRNKQNARKDEKKHKRIIRRNNSMEVNQKITHDKEVGIITNRVHVKKMYPLYKIKSGGIVK